MIHFAHDFNRLHHWERPEVTGEQADPDEGGFFRKLGELLLDVAGSLVFALYSCKYVVFNRCSEY